MRLEEVEVIDRNYFQHKWACLCLRVERMGERSELMFSLCVCSSWLIDFSCFEITLEWSQPSEAQKLILFPLAIKQCLEVPWSAHVRDFDKF